MATETGYIAMADISGYTSFVAATELEHSREILSELLEVTSRELEKHLVPVRLQGDAIICISNDDEVVPCLESAFVAFHRRVRAMVAATTCPCQACQSVPTLTLKFVAHYGTYSNVEVRGTKDLVGADVNIAFRLLKNHVPSHEYLLVTRPALEADDVAEVRAAVLDVLDGRCLLREELAAEVVERVGPQARSRLLSGFAFFGGANLCQGPPQGNKITLARPDQWVEHWEDVDEEEALREVCLRYVRTYGPARPTDFKTWFAFKPAARLFESLGDELEEIDVEGHRSFVLRGDTDFPDRQASVRLLPEYDVYIMGFREREHLVPAAVREQVARHGRGRYEGPAGVRFLLVDGVAAGLWERKKRGRRIELGVTPARPFPRARRADLEAEVARIGAFLGLEPVLTYGP